MYESLVNHRLYLDESHGEGKQNSASVQRTENQNIIIENHLNLAF